MERSSAAPVALRKTARFSVLTLQMRETKAPSKRARTTPGAEEAKSAPKAAGEGQSFARRDLLLRIQDEVQEQWRGERLFETDRHADSGQGKFLVTFPYPYMNGRLHLGHAFSMTKAEFRAHYERLKGRNVLFPFGFHCTGMPIQAAANKLRDELDEFGCPPQFEDDAALAAAKAAEAAAESTPDPAAKGKGKKSKLVAKTGTGVVRTWNILKRMVDEAEIPEFTDPVKWLRYFPPYGLQDLARFGAGVDWRRSFITTDVNPYYDSFIRWQFAKLRAGGRIKYGTRPAVYSIRDGGVCGDHDRASGEGATPQEYTIIKLRVPESALAEHPKLSPLAGKNVFLAPATLRPETMYGQTNCFVLPDGVYGAYEIKGGDVLVMSARAARGMMYQELNPEAVGEVKCLVEPIAGMDLMGLPLQAPQAAYETVYTLPLLSISMGKGTGVVTSVPSDAPDDYAALKQLQDKPAFAEKYGIEPHMVAFDVVPIIEVPGYGTTAAVFMYDKLGIQSPNDREKLAAAKDEVYLKGFTDGILRVGPYAGSAVKDVKAKIREDMLAEGTALGYWEPESKVMARSGEECIVALTEQWFLSYDDPDWTATVLGHVQSEDFCGYSTTVQGAFEHRVGWLGEWACSRRFGLGTRLPWDEEWIIESLSDSTIYMAYYTIAHLLQGEGNLDGTQRGPAGIPPEALTEAAWDCIFLQGAAPENSSVPASVFEDLKAEFHYWYPMDLRVSAKDLIPNHLTMSLFNHAAIWDQQPEQWPRGMYANGHILVDAEKMSKSKGNFIMLNESIRSFSADATRLACADAGDSSEDANFARTTANAAILNLTTELDFIETTMGEIAAGSHPSYRGENLKAWTFFDRCFENAVNVCIARADEANAQMLFREALKHGFFEMMNARDRYRDWAAQTGAGMHAGLLRRWMQAFVVLLAPFCPHWAEHLWRGALGHRDTVFGANWPAAQPEDPLISQMEAFLLDAIKDFRRATSKGGGKKRGGAAPAKAPSQAVIYVATAWPEWKQQVLAYMRETHAAGGGGFPATFGKDLKAYLSAEENGLRPQMKAAMQFGNYVRGIAEKVGPSALAQDMAFDQAELLRQHADYLAKQLGLQTVRVYDAADAAAPGLEKNRIGAEPGRPSMAML